MSTGIPPERPIPDEPSNRWPWVALVLGLLVVAAAVIVFFFNRPSAVNVNIEGTPTANPVARAGTASPPPTLVPPTLPLSATLAPSPTPVPSPSPSPAPPTPAPQPTQPPAPVAAATQPPAPAAAGTPQTAPAPAPPTEAPPTPAAAAPPPPTAAPSPTPFAGQPSNAGGAGNTRSDFDSAYGAPVGETPEHLVVYRKNNFEFHVNFVPDPNGRAALIVEQPQASSQALQLPQAQNEAHRLLPKDVQPPNATPEGNQQFVVERYTSQTLAQALPPEAFSGGQPGQLMIVYQRDARGAITRWVVGPGNDPNALIAQAH